MSFEIEYDFLNNSFGFPYLLNKKVNSKKRTYCFIDHLAIGNLNI